VKNIDRHQPLSAVSVIALSPNQQPDLQSWMKNLNKFEGSVLAQQITKSTIEAGQFLLPSLTRRTRDTGNHFHDSCCDVEHLKFDHIQEYIDQCRDLGDEDSEATLICVGEAAGICDSEGKITDIEKFGDMVANMYENNRLVPQVKKIATQIAEHLNEKHGDEEQGHKIVAFRDAFLVIKLSIDLKCPETLKISSDYCTELHKQMANRGRRKEEGIKLSKAWFHTLENKCINTSDNKETTISQSARATPPPTNTTSSTSTALILSRSSDQETRIEALATEDALRS
ncbi:hypothetical protein L9F63_017279, partial [Diploptera punctata]